jgi:hypothetical protein
VHYHEQSSTKARDGNEDCAHPLHEREVRFLDILAGRVMDRIDLPSQFPPVSRLAEVLSLPNPGVCLARPRGHQQGREHVHRNNGVEARMSATEMCGARTVCSASKSR